MKKTVFYIGVLLLALLVFVASPIAYFAIVDEMFSGHTTNISFPQLQDIPIEYHSASVFHTLQNCGPVILTLVDDDTEERRQISIVQEQLVLLHESNLISTDIFEQVVEKIQPQDVWIHSAITTLNQEVSVLSINFYESSQTSAYDSFCEITIDLSANKTLNFKFSFAGLQTNSLPTAIYDLRAGYLEWLGFSDIKDWIVITESDNESLTYSPSLVLSCGVAIIDGYTVMMSLYAGNY